MVAYKIQDQLYSFFFDLIREKAGINLSITKLTLVENRLKYRIAELGLSSLEGYISHIKLNPIELDHCIPLLTTHKTEWFREIYHYQWIQKEILSQKGQLNFWSAACSSGEEAYSLLFLCMKNGIAAQNLKILGTDISPQILEKAKSKPSEEAFQKQLHFMEKRMYRKVEESELCAYLDKSIKFRQHNLVSSPLGLGIRFDVILLRNVLIYFDRETVSLVIRNLLKSLRPGGFLILGLSESLPPDVFPLKNLGHSIYHYKG